jgi:hypothetical protein
MTRTFQRRMIGSGLIAEISADAWRQGSWTLTIDGTPQSHVDTEDPTELHFDYIQRIGHVIDKAFPSGEPITALHLGAGALTVPRYIDATRKGSRQQVVEIERELIDFVREHLPLPRGASIRCRYGDARAVMEALPPGSPATSTSSSSTCFAVRALRLMSRASSSTAQLSHCSALADCSLPTSPMDHRLSLREASSQRLDMFLPTLQRPENRASCAPSGSATSCSSRAISLSRGLARLRHSGRTLRSPWLGLNQSSGPVLEKSSPTPPLSTPLHPDGSSFEPDSALGARV